MYIYIDENNPTRREIERFKYGNKEEGKQHQYIKNTIATILEEKGFNVYVEQWLKTNKSQDILAAQTSVRYHRSETWTWLLRYSLQRHLLM